VSPYPRHGTRGRYQEPYLCRCLACSGRKGAQPTGYTPRWPSRALELFFGLEVLRMWVDEETLTQWRTDGLSDIEADRQAIKMGTMPYDIWGGYATAGLDFVAEVLVDV